MQKITNYIVAQATLYKIDTYIIEVYFGSQYYELGVSPDCSNIYVGSLLHLPNSSLKVIGQLGSSIRELDLSFCEVGHNLRPLEHLFGLRTLIMDNCGLSDNLCLTYIHCLQTLR